MPSNILIVTQSIDRQNTVLGFFHRWVLEFAKDFKKVTVICLEKGDYDLPSNVEVLSLGKEQGESKLKYISRFYNYIWARRKNYDVVFVHMNQEYVLLGAFLWKLLGKKVTMWRNHKQGSFLTKLAIAFSDFVFCTSIFSYTAKFKKTTLMPIGIDTEEFNINASARNKHSILFLGRIAPVKRVDLIIDALIILSKESILFTASIYGDALPKDKAYYDELVERVKANNLSSQISFHSGVPHSSTPDIYNAYSIFINITEDGSLDKTIVEAMACGSAVVTSNKALKNDIPPDYFIEKVNASEIAQKLKHVLSDQRLLDNHMRSYVIEHHSLKSLVQKYKEIISK